MKPNVRASTSIERGEAGRAGKIGEEALQVRFAVLVWGAVPSRAVVLGRTHARVQRGAPLQAGAFENRPEENRKKAGRQSENLKVRGWS
jgi:hypothetical protein